MKRTVIAVAAIVTLSAASDCVGADIHLLPKAQVNGRVVRLADIADAEGEGEKELQAIELAAAPPTGSSRTFTAAEVREMLARSEINVAKHRFFGASRTVVSSTGEQGATLPAAPEPKRLPPAPGVKAVRQAASVRQASVAPAAADVEKPAMLELVKRGDAVSLVVRSAGVRISTAAIAEADGAEGDLIEVRSAADRRKTFVARVVGHKQVEIQTGAAAKQPARPIAAPRTGS